MGKWVVRFALLTLLTAAALAACTDPPPPNLGDVVGAATDDSGNDGVNDAVEELAAAIDRYLLDPYPVTPAELTEREGWRDFYDEGERRIAEVEDTFTVWTDLFGKARAEGAPVIMDDGVNGDDLQLVLGDWIAAQREQTDMSRSCVFENTDPEACMITMSVENGDRWNSIAAELNEVRGATGTNNDSEVIVEGAKMENLRRAFEHYWNDPYDPEPPLTFTSADLPLWSDFFDESEARLTAAEEALTLLEDEETDEIRAAFNAWFTAQSELIDLNRSCVLNDSDPGSCITQGMAQNAARWNSSQQDLFDALGNS